MQRCLGEDATGLEVSTHKGEWAVQEVQILCELEVDPPTCPMVSRRPLISASGREDGKPLIVIIATMVSSHETASDPISLFPFLRFAPGACRASALKAPAMYCCM